MITVMSQRYSEADEAASEFEQLRKTWNLAAADHVMTLEEEAAVEADFDRCEPHVERSALLVRKAVRVLRTGELDRNILAREREFERRYGRAEAIGQAMSKKRGPTELRPLKVLDTPRCGQR